METETMGLELTDQELIDFLEDAIALLDSGATMEELASHSEAGMEALARLRQVGAPPSQEVKRLSGILTLKGIARLRQELRHES